MDIPLFVARGIAGGASVGWALDQLQAAHHRAVRENRLAWNGRTPPRFDRESARVELIQMIPSLDPSHPDSSMSRQARATAARS